MSLIFLTGMTGVGKTTVGRVLADVLGCDFIDTDAEIERETGLRGADIFVRRGEVAFREDEAQVIRPVCTREDGVIALGAGALERPDTREIVSKNGTLVYLRAPLELLVARCERMTDRPLLAGAHTRQELEEKLKAMRKRREPDYLRADVVVNVSEGETPKEIAARIVASLK